ncbi:hypothetical protein TanjilG_16478 [Lupinus angustifolius]|uniref:H/ACA ribonucleoprotein complex non-core subunit NAF1 n=1 Tax=Lupinus angustifolius TaxID=3871 RepID=A0A1J7IEP6_LUPAN|nr:hypothetical protein TanjilG_16478 [Lupinus angustifolius]
MASSSSASFSDSHTHPLHAEEDQDYALVDSFLNYYYDPNAMDVEESLQSQPAMEVKEPQPESEHELVSALAPVTEHEPTLELELVPEQEQKYENVGNSCCDNSIEKVVLHINGESGNRADVSNEVVRDNQSLSYRDDEMEEVEVEEGEIIESDGIEDGEEDYSDDAGDCDNNDVITSLVPHVDITLEPHHQMVPVGVIFSIMSVKVIVKSTEKHNLLNEGSVLWLTERQTPLGLIDEIIGPMESPYYCVRYNSENEVPVGINVETSISYVPEFAKHLPNHEDLYKKGSDASGVNDEEMLNEVDFSDDEKEAEYNNPEVPLKRCVVLALPAPNAPPMFGGGRGHHSSCLGAGRGRGERTPSSGTEPGRGWNSLHSDTGRDRGAALLNPPNTAPDLPKAPSQPLPAVHHNPHLGTGGGHGAAQLIPQTNAAPQLPTTPSQSLPAVHHYPQPLPVVYHNPQPLPAMHHNPQALTIMPPNPQPQNAMHPYGFLANRALWFQQNFHTPHQFPRPGMPFQQQFIPGQPIYAQGFMGQNHLEIGVRPPLGQIPPPTIFQCNSQQGNQYPPNQFHPGSSNRGRTMFHRGRGWRGYRPTK